MAGGDRTGKAGGKHRHNNVTSEPESHAGAEPKRRGTKKHVPLSSDAPRGYFLVTLRSLVFHFDDPSALSLALEAGGRHLSVPQTERLNLGEWVLVTVEVGIKRRATAAPARVTRSQSNALVLEFGDRDWERLLAFSVMRSEKMQAAIPSSEKLIASIPAPPSSESVESTSGVRSLRSAILESEARILVLDGDDGSRAQVHEMLTKLGFLVDHANTEGEALSVLAVKRVHAIVVDYSSRREVLASWFAGNPTKPPVLFVVAPDNTRDAVEAFRYGADDVVVKPFRAPELGARIVVLLDKHADRNPSTLGSPT